MLVVQSFQELWFVATELNSSHTDTPPHFNSFNAQEAIFSSNTITFESW